MNFEASTETPVLDFTRRLAPAPSFNEASRCVEEALDELRAAEASLEKQLSQLRNYLRPVEPEVVQPQAQAA
jgi:prefoldin subunit 5